MNSSSWVFACYALGLSSLMCLVVAGEVAPEILAGLKTSVCTNCDKITEHTGINPNGFSANVFDVPYDEAADIKVKQHKKCVVKVDKQATAESNSLTYSLQERRSCHSNGHGKFVTHLGSCGACSSLKDLAAYAVLPLENIAGQCAFAAVVGTPPLYQNGILSCAIPGATPDQLPSLQQQIREGDPVFMAQVDACLPSAFSFTRACLLQQIQNKTFDITPGCADVWAWNGINTGLKCGFDCSLTFTLDVPPNEPIIFPMYGFPKDLIPNPADGKSYCEVCPNTLDNGEPVCDPQASNITSLVEKSPYYLNDCLQCDECISGPYFLLYAGRTRRNSGLESLVNRPPNQVAEIDHVYGLPLN